MFVVYSCVKEGGRVLMIPPELIPILCFGAVVGLVVLTEALADRLEHKAEEEEESKE
jgi:hypothetical protein